MRRANVQLQADRRYEILEAAQTCFARSGFHQTSMQEICAQAGMSPGNLYRYFRSKEDIIAGIAERERAETAQQFAAVGNGATSSRASRRWRSTIWSSAAWKKSRSVPRSWRRAAAIRPWRASIRTGRRTSASSFIALLRSAAERGEVRRDIDFDGTVTVLFALADGLSWRRAVEPSFDAEGVMPIVLRHGRAVAGEPCRGRKGYGRIS